MKRRMGEYLEVDDSSGKSMIQCRKCKYVFCAITDNYKNYALVREAPLTSAGSLYSKTERFVLREFCCPKCATLLDVNTVLKESPIIWDLQLKERN